MAETATGTTRWETLEQWSPTVFLITGVVWAIDTAFNLYEIFASVTVPGILFGVFILSALLGTMVGALGFYRSIAERSPRSALAGAVPVATAGVLAVVTILWIAVAGVLNQRLPPGVLLLAVVVLIILGLLSFGVASVRSDAPSRTAGLLVLVLVATFLVWLAGVAELYESPEWSSAAFGMTLTVVSLATGYVLRTENEPTDRTEPTPDTTAR